MTTVQDSGEITATRVVGRPFAKGVSGNPGGRPRGLARYVRELVGDDGRRIAGQFLSAHLPSTTTPSPARPSTT
jgi:hypothetical protein